jgi:hypothetical protein
VERDEQPLEPGDEAPAGRRGVGESPCPRCGGTGRSGGAACPACGGTGLVEEVVGGG